MILAMSDISPEVQIETMPTLDPKDLFEGSQTHSDIYIDKEKGKLTKVFRDPNLIENIRQYELYRDYGKISPILSPYYEGVLPDGKGLLLKFIENSKSLRYIGKEGNVKLADGEIDDVINKLEEHQKITGTIMYGGDFHSENILIQTQPDGKHNIFLIDVGGKVDGDVTNEEMFKEREDIKRMIKNNSL